MKSGDSDDAAGPREAGPSLVRGTPEGRAPVAPEAETPPASRRAPRGKAAETGADAAKGKGKEPKGKASKAKEEPAGPRFERDEAGRVVVPADDIASDAYVVDLPKFEGPLDMLLHLIQKHELDILDIPIGFVTSKYLAYLSVMRELSIDVASEYLVMAATLTHIKSKMLLPEVPKDGAADGEEEEELDPRAELVRRLLEYQKYKAAALDLNDRDTLGNSVFPRGADEPVPTGPAPFASLGVFELLEAFSKVLGSTKAKVQHEVVFDRISISDRIVELTDRMRSRRSLPFEELFALEKERGLTRFDVVITFLAILEMARLKMLRVFQTDSLSPIHVELAVLDDDDDPLAMKQAAPSQADPSEAALSEAALSEAAEASPEAADEAPGGEPAPEAEAEGSSEQEAGEADAEAEGSSEPEAGHAASAAADAVEPEADDAEAGPEAAAEAGPPAVEAPAADGAAPAAAAEAPEAEPAREEESEGQAEAEPTAEADLHPPDAAPDVEAFPVEPDVPAEVAVEAAGSDGVAEPVVPAGAEDLTPEVDRAVEPDAPAAPETHDESAAAHDEAAPPAEEPEPQA